VVRASAVVEDRGRVYVVQEKYRSIHVFSRDVVELDLLERAFGGRHYPHGTGYTWMLGEVNALKKVAEELLKYVGDESRVVRDLVATGLLLEDASTQDGADPQEDSGDVG
jgi:hypothetical protein